MGHLRDDGFDVTVVVVDDIEAVQAEHNIAPEFRSCHTALVGDYVIEGHVPADAIRRFLEEGPELAGLAVPGMPVGSPGMGGRSSVPWSVLALDRDGGSTVYESH